VPPVDIGGVDAPVTTATTVRRLLPYAAATLLAFVLVALDEDVDSAKFAGAAALVGVVGALAVAAPWTSLPRSARLVPALLYLVAVSLLRDSAGGSTAGVGVMAMLPICWLALHGTRRELFLALAGVAAFWALPVAFLGGDHYPVTQLRTGTLYVAVASMIGLTVQALVSALAAHAGNVARVASAARAISAAPDARSEICAAACDASGAGFAALFEPADDGGLRSTAMAGLAAQPMSVAPAGEPCAAMLAFATRSPVFAAAAGVHPAVSRRMWEANGRPASMLFEPVLRGDVTVGVLAVGWAEPVADAHSGGPALIGLLAIEAGSAIAHADLVAQLGRLAATDPLTGLANRRAWDGELERVLHAEPRPDGCVAMLDLDHFKAYNDEHGHLAGDRLLKQAAAAWAGELRSGDVLARLGGEEFGLLLSGCTPEHAASVVERLRAAMPAGQTCSAGLVSLRRREPAEALMTRADDALYAAKQAGRDRLSVARD
jgi:diguanylate cyclase (GGDEF)-like protein